MDVKPVVLRTRRERDRTLLAGVAVSLVLGGGGFWTAITDPLLSSAKSAYLYHLPGVARVIMGVISLALLIFALVGFLVAFVTRRPALTLSLAGLSVDWASVRGFRVTWHEIGELFLVSQPGPKSLFRVQFKLVDNKEDLSFLPHQESDGQGWYEIPLDFTPKKLSVAESAIRRFRPRLIERDIRTSTSMVS